MKDKSDILTIRISPETRLRLNDMAASTGHSVSTVVKAAMSRLFSEVYDASGNLMSPDISPPPANPLPDMEGGFFRIDGVASFLGIQERTIRVWASRGIVRSMKVDGRAYVNMGSVRKQYGKWHGQKDKHD